MCIRDRYGTKCHLMVVIKSSLSQLYFFVKNSHWSVRLCEKNYWLFPSSYVSVWPHISFMFPFSSLLLLLPSSPLQSFLLLPPNFPIWMWFIHFPITVLSTISKYISVANSDPASLYSRTRNSALVGIYRLQQSLPLPSIDFLNPLFWSHLSTLLLAVIMKSHYLWSINNTCLLYTSRCV